MRWRGSSGLPQHPDNLWGGPTAAPSSARLILPRYQAVLTEEGAYLEEVIPSKSDRCLVQVYGDNVHQNNGFRMDGGITDDEVWHIWWWILFSQFISVYCAPQKGVDWLFFVPRVQYPWGTRAML